MFFVGCLAVISPRLAFALVWLFGDGYIDKAVQPWIWILLGFLFMPLTTLTFAYAMNSLAPMADVSPLGWVLIAIAGLIDLGILGGGHRATRRDDS